MEEKFDVWALEKENDLPYGSGDYRAMAKVTADSGAPDTQITGWQWVRIAHRVENDMAQEIMNQYPHTSQAK